MNQGISSKKKKGLFRVKNSSEPVGVGLYGGEY
jgi:hypothetical protein